MNIRPTILNLARAGAVVFALTACGYLVVTAQRRANPVVEHAPITVDAEFPASGLPIAPRPGAQSGTVGSNDPFDFEATTTTSVTADVSADKPAFLYGSKSLVLEPTAVVGAEGPDTVVPPLEPAPGFLPSSKVGVIATPEPEFLPSSKVKVLSPLRPQAATGGTSSTSAPVFLPSSKSLRVEVQKPPAPKPAPVAPPKNP